VKPSSLASTSRRTRAPLLRDSPLFLLLTPSTLLTMRSNFARLTALALAPANLLGAAPHAHAQGTRVSGRQASGRQAVVPRPTRSTAGDEPCVIYSSCGDKITSRSSVAPAAPAAPKTRHSGHGTVIVEATTDTSVSPILTSNFNQGWYRDGILETPIPIHDPGDPSYIVGSLFIFGSDNEF